MSERVTEFTAGNEVALATLERKHADERDALSRDLAAARAALERYGTHDPGHGFTQTGRCHSLDNGLEDCTCGLDALLRKVGM